VVFVVTDDAGHSPVWLAALDGRSAPRRVTANDAWKAFFGADDDVLFLGEENGAKIIYRIKEDGSELKKIVRTATGSLFHASPDGKWVVVVPASHEEARPGVMVHPVGGGSPRLICETCVRDRSSERGPGPSVVSWSPDGKFLYLNFQSSVYAIPLRPGQMLPPIPVSGFRTKQEVAALPGARLIPEQDAFVGPNPSVYAFSRFATQRNIYRVPVP